MQRFYGGEPAGWWDVPLKELEYYVEELPRLQAQEQLRGIRSGWLASPPQSKGDTSARRKALADIEKEARPYVPEGDKRAGAKLSMSMASLLMAEIGVSLRTTEPEE